MTASSIPPTKREVYGRLNQIRLTGVSVFESPPDDIYLGVLDFGITGWSGEARCGGGKLGFGMLETPHGAQIYFYNTIVHELSHTLGLDHTRV